MTRKAFWEETTFLMRSFWVNKMNKLFIWLVLLTFVVSISAQSKVACEADRYEKDLFPNFTKKTVEYAAVKSWKGENVSLSADIYEPKDDSATLRPLIIFAHGGSFIWGNKEQVAPLCTRFTKKGYVTASIQYRLIPPDKVREQNAILRELFKAVNDMKAAIRFFRQSVANGNPYKIDPNFIFVGGISAGALTALQVGVLDENDEINSTIAEIMAEEGGLDGDSGSAENRKYSSKVSGIFNLSGAILVDNWIEKTDAPIFSYHGTDDPTVSIGYRKVGELGLYGSEPIKEKADKVGLENILVKVPGGGHTDVYTPKFANYLNDFQKQVNQKIRSMICGGIPQKN